MAVQTYSPSKTVTLNEDKADTAEKLSAAPPVKEDTKTAANNNYPSHKSITLSAEKSIAPASSNEVSINNNPPVKTDDAPASKTVSTIEEKPKTENPETQNKTVVSPSIDNSSNTNYPARKTINLGNDTPSVTTEEKPKIESAAPSEKTAVSPLNSAAGNTYLSHKSVSLDDKGTAETAALNTNTENKSTVVRENETTPPPVKTTVNPADTDSKQIPVNAYPNHKSVSFANEDKALTTPAANENQPEVKKQEPVTADKNEAYYPPIKTAEITNEEKVIADETVKEKEAVSPEIKPLQESSQKTSELPNGIYLSHKTFSFVKEEIKVTAVNETAAPVKTAAAAVKQEAASVVKTETAAAKNIQQTVPAAPVKQKKPVLWIILTAFFFLTTVAAAFFVYKQHHDLSEEVTQLKQSKEDLNDELKKFKKDIFIDDLITRGVKFNPKSDVTVVASAAESEGLRVCFSVTGNLNAKKGKKAVYLRLIAPDGKILTNGKEEMLEYKGNKIPYSFKENIDFKNQELMLCFDFKPSAKLVKGEYKAEIYNEGVMDGTAAFELK